jgi:hypothetical protein
MTTITDALIALDQAMEGDEAFLLAGAVNLYSEAIRSRQGRVLYGPADVRALLGICKTLIQPPETLANQPYERHGRPRAPMPVEREVIMDVTQLRPKVGGIQQSPRI